MSNHRLSACCRLAGASIKTKEVITNMLLLNDKANSYYLYSTHTLPILQPYYNYTLPPSVVRLLSVCCSFVVRLFNEQQTNFKQSSIELLALLEYSCSIVTVWL